MKFFRRLLLALIFLVIAAAPSLASGVPILIYHHIQKISGAPGSPLHRWSISPENFEKQIAWIARQGFHPITMRQLTDHLKQKTPLPPNPIVLSFDDGWKDHYEIVFPLLKKHGFVATFFITTDSVGHSSFVSWKQLEEMSEAGMDIQPHSLTHPHLDWLGQKDAWREIIESKKAIEKHLKKPATIFAYPFGGYNSAVIQMVKRAGFESAVTVSGLNHGFVQSPNNAIYTLPRFAITGDDSIEDIAKQLLVTTPVKTPEMPLRGLYISVMQDPVALSSPAEAMKLIDFAKRTNTKMLFVQVYRSNKAWFSSKVADDSPYVVCRKNFNQDPLAFLIHKAHQEGIEVHAWLNLLSLGANAEAPMLKKHGNGILTKNLKEKKKIEDYKIDNQYFLEPGDPRVREDLSKIVTELLGAYPDLDGIQFDYIRYPDQNPHYGYTPVNMERFKKATGLATIEEDNEVWKRWKRDQVTELLTMLVHKTHQLRPKMQVSTTGCMPYLRAHDEAFQDWPSWVDTGLVDFVTIMNYAADPVEFKKSTDAAKAKTSDFKKVKIAIGAYKFVNAPEAFSEELRICEDEGATCVIFHYGNLQENPHLADLLVK